MIAALEMGALGVPQVQVQFRPCPRHQRTKPYTTNCALRLRFTTFAIFGVAEGSERLWGLKVSRLRGRG